MSRNVRKLENGRWEARERLGGRESRRLSKTFDRKGDAERWVDEIRRMRQLGQVAQLDAGRQRLDAFIQTYRLVHAVPNLEQSTRDMYGHVWEKHIRPRLGDRQLVDITPKVVNRFRAEMVAAGIGDPTVRKALTVLQSVLTLAVTEEEISANSVAKIRKPSLTPTRERVPIPVLTIERLRAGMSRRDRVLVSVMAYAGLRPQEALALRFDDMGERTLAVTRKVIDGRVLPYTKTRGHRHVRLLAPLKDELIEWRTHRAASGSELLFARRDGEPWLETDYRNWRRRSYGPAARAVGLDDSRPYDLRATWVSLMISEGHTVVEVARQAGHSPETCLRHYARVFAEYDPAARVPAEAQIGAARADIGREPSQQRLQAWNSDLAPQSVPRDCAVADAPSSLSLVPALELLADRLVRKRTDCAPDLISHVVGECHQCGPHQLGGARFVPEYQGRCSCVGDRSVVCVERPCERFGHHGARRVLEILGGPGRSCPVLRRQILEQRRDVQGNGTYLAMRLNPSGVEP